jgi:hypothetical protein
VAGQVRKPILLVLASPSVVNPIGALFGGRGFQLAGFDNVDALKDYVTHAKEPIDAALLDFETPRALDAARILGDREGKPVIVGLGKTGEPPPASPYLDAGFTRPVDPARLFARVVILIGERKPNHQIAGRKHRITGIVAVVQGNKLFHMVERQLWSAVPPINAGAILEKVLFALHINPTTVTVADVAAAIASGRLQEQLVPFAKPEQIAEVLVSVENMLRGAPMSAA